ncbi:MAG: DNA polymerase III subunit beta [Acidobacteria bacterium]|nr:DNA polymerase III subunit beta [Acidobacteriota bacterium]
MEIRLDRSEFLTELTPMQGIVERKSTIPVLSHLLLTARDGKLHLAATDLDVSLTSWCEADVEVEGGIAVQAKKFMEIIRSLRTDEVSLRLDEPKTLAIHAGNSRFKIHGLAAEDFPTLPSLGEETAIQIPFEDFRRMIGKVIFAISADESRFQLSGALLRITGDSLIMVATDGHRLAVVESALKGGERDESSVLVPRKALQELQRFDGKGELTYQKGAHHLSFRIGRRELICRILEGSFPDYERVISNSQDKKVVFDTQILLEATQRVALLTGDRARGVRMSFSPGELVISAANPDLGEANEKIPCPYEGESFAIGLNPDYIRDFLAALATEKVRLELKDEDSQCVGYPMEGTDKRYLCVIMPMRL